jgi:hypothetical protein
MVTSFVPDIAGTYVVQLVVNDGTLDSDPSTVQIQAVDAVTEAIQAIQDCEAEISSLDSSVFKNANMQNTLINKLNAVIANIEAGNYEDALGQLENDVLGKMDGCATSGSPDKNDWIKDCEAQGEVYSCIVNSISAVESLMTGDEDEDEDEMKKAMMKKTMTIKIRTRIKTKAKKKHDNVDKNHNHHRD